MKWFVAMTVPCAFLALLCACGQERDSTTPDVRSAKHDGGPAPDMLPPPGEAAEREPEDEPWLDWRAEGHEDEPGSEDERRSRFAELIEQWAEKAKKEAKAKAKKEADERWPGIDDDPSFDNPPGSGAWCGTGMRHPPSFRPELGFVTFEIRKGRIHRVGRAWSEPDGEGIERRFFSAHLTARQIADMEERRIEIEMRLHDLEDPMKKVDADPAALRKELTRINRALQRHRVGFVQYGRTLDGVRYESEHGESVDDFIARTTKAHAEPDGAGDDPASKDDGPRLPDPMADEAAGRAWSGPHADGFWRRLITDKRKRPEDEPRFGPEFPSVVQWGLERDGVFYTSRLGESAEAFVRRVAKEAASAKAEREAAEGK